MSAQENQRPRSTHDILFSVDVAGKMAFCGCPFFRVPIVMDALGIEWVLESASPPYYRIPSYKELIGPTYERVGGLCFFLEAPTARQIAEKVGASRNAFCQAFSASISDLMKVASLEMAVAAGGKATAIFFDRPAPTPAQVSAYLEDIGAEKERDIPGYALHYGGYIAVPIGAYTMGEEARMGICVRQIASFLRKPADLVIKEIARHASGGEL